MTNSFWIIFIVFHLLCDSPSEKGRNPVVQEELLLRVMTYNIHHANPPSKAEEGTIDLQAIAKVINDVRPDLVALQEVDVYNSRSGEDLNEAQALAEMTGMHYSFTQAIEYRGGQYGNAVLSRYPIVEANGYQLPVADTINPNGEIRALCMQKISLPLGREIFFASTHLDHCREETHHLLQAEKIIDIVGKLSLPILIGGDFNAVPDSRTIRLLENSFTRTCTIDCP